MGVTVLVFAVELQKGRTKCIFSDFWERTGASFKIECMWKGKRVLKNPFLQNLHRDITFKTKSLWVGKVSKHKLNIHYRGSPRGSGTQQHAYRLRYAHSQHTESHLGKKQQQAKISIPFLFSQLHFNNVTSRALFYGSHLVMRSKRCAVQN